MPMLSPIDTITEMLKNTDEKKQKKIIEIVLLIIPAEDRVLDVVHKTVIAIIKYKK